MMLTERMPSSTIAYDRLMSVGAVLSTPVVVDDTIYFGSWDGQLYAIG